MYISIALISGVLVIISMVMNSRVGAKIGVFQSALINYGLGLVVSTMILLVNLKTVPIEGNIPLWAYLGGVIGFSVVVISNIIIPKIPTIYTTLLIFIGQLFTGIMIDSFTGGVVSKGKIIGGVLILAGLLYNLMIDKKELQA